MAGTEFFQLTLSGTASTSTASAGHSYGTSETWQESVLGQRESGRLYDHMQHTLNNLFAGQQQTACHGTLAAQL